MVQISGTGSTPSSCSSHAIANGPYCDCGLTSSLARTASTWFRTACAVRFGECFGARERDRAQS